MTEIIIAVSLTLVFALLVWGGSFISLLAYYMTKGGGKGVEMLSVVGLWVSAVFLILSMIDMASIMANNWIVVYQLYVGG